MSTSTYTVAGMTCDHCVASVTEEVSEVAGVGEIDINLATGRLTVTRADPDDAVDDAAVRAAVAEAGYQIVDQANAAGGGS